MAEVDVPAPGGTFSGATTDRGRTPGGRFNGDGISGFVATALQDSILWIGPNVPTADQFVLWINTTDGRWYGKWNDGDSTQWVDLSLPFGEGLPGPQGPQGERGLTGPVGQGIPTGGAANEILVKVDATDYNTAWGARPADGLNVLNGSAAPTGGDGVDGEFWIDTTAWDIYGPKSSGAWPAGVSLIGPTGDTGAAGADGADGADGQGVPIGGTAGQKLEKIDGTDYNTQWVDVNEPPTGGTAGQALRKVDGTDHNYGWADVDEVPDGGTAGQLLSKVDGTDQNLAWTDPPTSLPSGGTTGQVLTKDSATDGDASWQDAAGGGGILAPRLGDYTDVSGSRVINTSYQNTGTTNLHVNLGGVRNTSLEQQLQVSPDNSTWTALGRSSTGGGGSNIKGIVPPNWYYRVAPGGGSTTINQWTEAQEELVSSSATPSEEISGTTYTFVADDAQKWKYTSNASAVTLTIDASAFAVETEVFIEQRGAGLVSFAAAVGTTINSRGSQTDSAGQYAVMGFKVISSTEVRLFGDLA